MPKGVKLKRTSTKEEHLILPQRLMRIKKSYFLIKTRNLQILDPQKLSKHGASQSIYMFHTKPKQLPSKLSNLASVIVWFQSNRAHLH